MAVIMPVDFLWISIVSGFVIIGVGLALYLIPWEMPDSWSPIRRYRKKSKPCLVDAENEKKVDHVSRCPSIANKCYNNGEKQVPDSSENIVKTQDVGQNLNLTKDKNSQPPAVIGPPQGNGFYTSGPWKIDPLTTLGPEMSFGPNFSTPELIMSEYFASMMTASAQQTISDYNPEDEGYLTCHISGNQVICGGGEGEDEDDSNINDYGVMDMDQSDADMMMIVF